MTKLLSCRYNMDTNRVEARFEDETVLSIDCAAVEGEYCNTLAQRAELDWKGTDRVSHRHPVTSCRSTCTITKVIHLLTRSLIICLSLIHIEMCIRDSYRGILKRE